MVPSESSEEEFLPFLSSGFWGWPVILDVSWLAHTSLQSLLLFSPHHSLSLCVLLLSLFLEEHLIASEYTLIQYLILRCLIIPTKMLFLNNFPFAGSECTYFLLEKGHHSNHCK